MRTLALLAGLLMPPEQYDHAPTRPYAVHLISPAAIEQRCHCLDLMVRRLSHPDARALGCTDLGTMTIWIDNTLPPDLRAKVLRHERAHVNGWRHH